MQNGIHQSQYVFYADSRPAAKKMLSFAVPFFDFMHCELGKAHAGKKGDEEADEGQNVYKAIQGKKSEKPVHNKKEYYKIYCGEHKHQKNFHGCSPQKSGMPSYSFVWKHCLFTIIPARAARATDTEKK